MGYGLEKKDMKLLYLANLQGFCRLNIAIYKIEMNLVYDQSFYLHYIICLN